MLPTLTGCLTHVRLHSQLSPLLLQLLPAIVPWLIVDLDCQIPCSAGDAAVPQQQDIKLLTCGMPECTSAQHCWSTHAVATTKQASRPACFLRLYDSIGQVYFLRV